MAAPVSELTVEIIPRARLPVLRSIPWVRRVILEGNRAQVAIRLTNTGSQVYSGGSLELQIAQYAPGLVPMWSPWRTVDIPSLAPGRHRDRILEPEYFPYSGYWNIKPACSNANLKGKAGEPATWLVVRVYAVLEIFLVLLTAVAVAVTVTALVAALC